MEENELTLNEAFAKLDELLKDLGSSQISLEESFDKYQEGMALLKLCNSKIDRVEKKILMINDQGETDEF